MIYKFQKPMVRLTTFLMLSAAILYAGPLKGNDQKSENNQTTTTEDVQPAAKTIFDVLSEQGELLDVTVELDLAPLLENRFHEDAEKGTFTFKDANKKNQKLDIKVRLRGKYRRKVCEFPPLMIKFAKKELKAMGLSKHNDIKLVTHCVNDKLVGNDNVGKEYLTYKLYQELTDQSYRVQMVRITYTDVNGNYPKKKRIGFLIEDTDEMAERLGGEECETCINQPADSINAKSENLMALFQFMIGNADFSTALVRNVKIVTQGKDEAKLVVPYDFDFAGLINATYAIPNTDFGLKSTQERVYLGYYADKAVFTENLNIFLEKKKTLRSLIKSCKYINAESKSDMLLYLDTFYDFIEKDLDYQGDILQQMRAQGGDYSGPAAQFLKGGE